MAADDNQDTILDGQGDTDLEDSLAEAEGSDDDDDLEAQMAAAMAADSDNGEGLDDDLEAQMAATIAQEMGTDDEELDLEGQMAAAMNGGDDLGDLDDEFSLDDLDEDDSDMSVPPLDFPQLQPSDDSVGGENIERLMDVTLNLSVELGRKQMQIKEILGLGPGKIIELDKLAGEPVDLLVNGKILAKGEVVVVDENFGVRITDLVTPRDRVRML